VARTKRIGVSGRHGAWGYQYLGLAAAVFLLCWIATASTASASQTHRLTGEVRVANAPDSVAVDQSDGDVYVLESEGLEQFLKIARFDAEGNAAPFTASASYITGNTITGTTGGSPHLGRGAGQIAVAPPGARGGTAGDIYVATGGLFGEPGVVLIYAQSGKYVGQINAANGEPFAIDPGSGAGGAGGVATDPSGNIYLAEQTEGRIDKYVPSANPPTNGDYDSRLTGLEDGSGANNLAASSSLLYGTTGRGGGTAVTSLPLNLFPGGGGEVDASSAAEPVEADGEPLAGSAVAVDPATGDLYVNQEGDLVQLDTAGVVVSRFGSPPLCAYNSTTCPMRSKGVAVDSSAGASAAQQVYATQLHEDEPGVLIAFGPQITVADPITEPATAIAGSSATLNGTVDPDGLELNECKFEWGITTSYENSMPCTETPAQIGAGHAAVPVEAALGGLNGGTAYHFRLVVTNANGPSDGADKGFTTTGPQIHAVGAVDVSDTSARLEALIDPEGSATGYQFEYATEAQFQASGFGGAGKIPPLAAEVGTGMADVLVAQDLAGLAPDTTYRYRVVASSSEAVSTGGAESFRTFSSNPSVGACPNEALRVGPSISLPDCRAYEQASPVNKDGANVRGAENRVEASASGDAITFYTSLGIPGGEGGQDIPTFMARRSVDGDGWSTQGLLPSGSVGPRARLIGWDEALAASYSVGGIPGGAFTFYRRDGFGGGLTPVTEVGTGAAGKVGFAAGADEGKIALFDEEGDQLVPGAATASNNVYLWDQATGRLGLAGVLNDGQAPAQGAFAGSYDWFSAAPSTEVGGASAEAEYLTGPMHVLSRDASAAFFTAAGTGEVYMRRNPLASQSKLDKQGECIQPVTEAACTVQISKSQKNDGDGPEGTDPDGPRPAAFVGATPAGSAALLMSSEELTNNATTGSAAIVRANLAGGGPEANFLPAAASGIAVDGGHIYWANSANGWIGRARVDGTEPEPKFITGASDPQGVAVDGSHVYWTNAGTGAKEAGTIGRANLDGSGVNQSFIKGATDPQGIAVNATSIFWVNAGNSEGTRKIGHANLDGTGVIQTFISVIGASDLAVEGPYVYWTNPVEEAIGRAGTAGTEVTPKFLTGSTIQEPHGIATGPDGIYWSDAATGAISHAELEGGAVETLSRGTKVDAVAVDSAHLYWSEDRGDPGKDLYRYVAADGSLTDLTPDPADLNGAEVKGVLGMSEDGSFVYFVANGRLAPGATSGSCTANGEGSTQGGTGECNLYVWHEGETTFLTRLRAKAVRSATEQHYLKHEDFYGDMLDWAPSVLRASKGTAPNTARVSRDGRTLLFRSNRNLTGYDSEGWDELYRYTFGGGISCVSCSPVGAPPTGPAEEQIFPKPLLLPQFQSALMTRNMSLDGDRIFFASPDKLVPTDTNGVYDVYEWEAPDPTDETDSCHSEAQNGGCLYLISTGTNPESSFFMDASADGSNVFFTTRQSLVGQDKDELVDVYDARVDGGMAGQNPVETICSEEACKPAAVGPPGSSSPAAPSGGGNVKQPKPLTCKRGFKKVKRHGKAVCVRKHGQKKHKRHHGRQQGGRAKKTTKGTDR
jgi:hypothetical protein